MEENTLQKLKSLKSLHPSDSYARSSLAFILQTPQQAPKSFAFWGSTRVLTGALALVMLLTLSALSALPGGQETSLAELDGALLEKELEGTELEIVEIKKIRYFNESAERVASALDEVSGR